MFPRRDSSRSGGPSFETHRHSDALPVGSRRGLLEPARRAERMAFARLQARISRGPGNGSVPPGSQRRGGAGPSSAAARAEAWPACRSRVSAREPRPEGSGRSTAASRPAASPAAAIALRGGGRRDILAAMSGGGNPPRPMLVRAAARRRPVSDDAPADAECPGPGQPRLRRDRRMGQAALAPPHFLPPSRGARPAATGGLPSAAAQGTPRATARQTRSAHPGRACRRASRRPAQERRRRHRGRGGSG